MRYITLVAAALLVAACSGGGNRGNAGNMTDTSAGAVGHPAAPGSASTGAQMDTTGMSRDTSMRHDTSGGMSHDTSGAAGATSHDTGSSH